MTEEKYFAVAKEGQAKLNKMALTTEEADALISVLQGTLVSDIDGGKKKKLTREVLANTLTKIAVRSGIFVRKNRLGKASEEGKKKLVENLKRQIEAAVSQGSQAAAADPPSSDVAVCRFYKVGKCKFSKKKQ